MRARWIAAVSKAAAALRSRYRFLSYRATPKPDYHWVLRLALNQLKADLCSEHRAEVIEDLRREAAFWDWCGRIVNLDSSGVTESFVDLHRHMH